MGKAGTLITVAVLSACVASCCYTMGRRSTTPVSQPAPVVEQTKTDTGTTSTETPSVAPEEQQTPEPDVPRDYTAALESARSHSKHMHMSTQRIYDQLTSSADQFTPEEAQYAIDHL